MMNGESGYFYLNLANEWPKFVISEPDLEKTAAGALALAKVDENTYAARGLFAGGPFATPADTMRWHRLRVDAAPLPDGAHVQLFTFTAADELVTPYDLAAGDPFPAAAGWQARPRDVLDILILNSPARHLWVGGVVRSDGQASPSLYQMRVEYGRDTYLNFLPAIYARNEGQRDFLERFLSLHQSVLAGLEGTITDLPLLFDPLATPDGQFPSWLAWLAGWLAFDLNEAWTETETRQYLAQAFQLYGQRGTIEGLRRYLKWYAGVEARIEEPGLQTTLWSLGEVSTLGFTTMLAPAYPQGAVVGTSATLDQSHLTQGDDFGAALFEDLAHRFCVQVYCAELTRPGALADVQAVLEREKPAHTTYHLCLIEPRLHVGFQARVGIDAIVAAGPPAAQVGMTLDMGTLAAAEQAEACEPEPVPLAAAIDVCEDEKETDDE
jgi:phage tail-like protein